MVSNPRLQAAYHIFSNTRPPFGTARHAEWKAEVQRWTRTAELEDYGLSGDDWEMFSTGVHPAEARKRRKARGKQANQAI